MRRQGFGALTQTQALTTLDTALTQPHPHLVPIRIETAVLRRALESGEELPPVFRSLVRARPGRAAGSSTGGVGFRERLAALSEDERRAAVIELVRREIAIVLGAADPQGIATDQPLKELGLDSLMAVELRRRLAAQVRGTLPADLAFTHPSPDALATYLLAQVFDSAPDSPRGPLPLERAAGRAEHPATEGQRRLWFLEQMNPGTAQYHVAMRLRPAGRLDREALGLSLNWMAARHEALRTGLASRDGRLVQVVHEDVTIPLAYDDLSGLGPDAVDECIRQEELKAFDLGGPSLLRGRLLDTGADGQILCLTFHHSMTDGWSLTVFLRELYDAYRSFVSGTVPERPEPAHHVGDYARWERRSLDEGAFDEALRFFRAELDGAPILELPPGPQDAPQGGDSVYFSVPAELRERLENLASAASVTPYTVFAAAFAVLLGRYADQDDFTIGTLWANRQLPGSSDVLGFLTNTLPLRCDLTGDPAFTELLTAVQPRVLGLLEHQGVPLTEVMKGVGTPRAGDDNPLIRAVFNYMGADFPALGEGEDAWILPNTAEGAGNVRGASKFALGMNLAPSGDGLWGELEFLSHVMDRAAAERMVRNFRTLLESLADQPHRRISELDLLDAAELAWLEQRGGLATAPDDRDRVEDGTTALDLVLAQARRTPDAVALVSDGRELTYRQMVVRAGLLSERLRAAGVTAEVPVGVHLPRSADLVVSVLAIWLANGAYLPVDPGYPQARVDYVVEDSGLTVLISDRPVATDAKVVLISEIPEASEDASWPEPVARPALSDLGYVIYTSGSTGRPKGVLIEHGQFVNFCRSVDERISGGPGDTWLAVTSPSFDISTVELIWTLTRGYRVVIAQGSVGEWPDYRSYGPTHLQCTPSLARMLLADAGGRALLGGLDRMIVGGEALDRPLARKLLRTVRGGVTNIYGPSECTVWSTTWHVEPGEVSLGDAVLNTSLYVLDSHGARVPRGSRGELWIGGRAVTRGYLGRPELTAERYVDDPFRPGERMYRTGDLVRYREDGSLEYCGRIDSQTKLYGHRIELGEIEAVAGEHPRIVECAAVVREDTANEPRLYLYWTGRPTDEDTLRAYVAERVPAYMVPARLVRLDELPHTPNKKVDRGALAQLTAPGGATTDSASAAPAPTVAIAADAVEGLVRRAWASALDRSQIDPDRGFFELGGSSMTALHVHTRLCEELGREFPLSAIFRYPTVRQLAAFLRGEGEGTGTSRTERAAAPRAEGDDAIAIVGMSCRLPGAPDVDTFWHNLRDGVESITRFSETELRAAGIPDTLLADPHYVRAKGHVEDADLFDASFFDYSPAEAEVMDPQHRLFLECAWQALEHSGIVPQSFDGRVGVFGGSGFGGYAGEEVNDMSSFFRTMIGTKNDYFATRVAHKLNLRGPALSVQTACSTGLVAAHLARESLLRGESDVALVGASSLTVPLKQGYMYQEGLVLSADGTCRAFDEKGGGTVFGSGVGVVVLRRLSDALDAGDTVYAVIRGSAINNDGANKVGFTAPSVAGQAQVIADAQAAAGVVPGSVGLIEAHGTATALGDPIEVQALQEVFGGSGREEPCALGSVKTNIGHTDVTAGLAGLIKAALCLHHRELVPSLNFDRPNPEMGLDPDLFYVNTELRAWEQDGPRRAGVSSFGIGGTNAHVVLEEAPQPEPAPAAALPAALPVVLSARDENALREQADRWATWLGAHPDASMHAVASTAAARRTHFTERAAVVAGSAVEAAEALTALAEHRSHRALSQ
ncbi:amino acid adenylation domain-containing protein, partial [Streptomyces sp. NPDC002851]